MTKEESLLAKRFLDLSRQAEQKGIVLFSDFLNLNELNIFRQGISELYSGYEVSGGYELSERQMIAFIPDALCYAWEYPIACLKITPLNKKFAETLSHRDVLGSLMNLGIERSKLGDILVNADEIYVFCHQNILSYLMEELTRIRHTVVKSEEIQAGSFTFEPQKELVEGIPFSGQSVDQGRESIPQQPPGIADYRRMQSRRTDIRALHWKVPIRGFVWRDAQRTLENTV